ncbi:formate dehydrogenase accessory protein FdhE [Desulfovulcanus sp.]
MDKDVQRELGRFEKRMDMLKKKGTIPEDLLRLVSFIYKRQLNFFALLNDVLDKEVDFPSSEDVVRGKPMLPRENFPYDFDASQKLFSELLAFLQEQKGHLGEAAEIVAQDLSKGQLDLSEAYTKYLAGDDHYFRLYGEKTPVAPRTLNFLIQASITPSLVKTGYSISLLLPPDQVWKTGHCPVCGSLPLISELKDKQGFRYATCSFCQTSYRVPRMSCVFCQEDKKESLEYFQVSEEPGFRVDVCKSCKMYIKTVDFREMDKLAIPPLDDLESLPLDLLARKQGYTRPTLSAWGF